MALYHCGRLLLLLVFISILNALIKYYPVQLGPPAHCHFDCTKLAVYFATLCVCFGACQNVTLLWPRQLDVSLNPPLCYVSLTATLCVSWRFDFSNPFLLNNSPFCVFSLPPLRLSEGSFSFCTCSLLSHRLALKDQTLLLFHYHFDRSLTTSYCFVRPLFLSPSLIPTSSSQLAYLHCNINSKLYSMLSTCPSVSPISIPPFLSTSASFPRSLTPGRTTVRLRGGGGIRWLPTSQSCQTWCPHAVH